MRRSVAIVLGGVLALLVLGAAIVVWTIAGPETIEASSPPPPDPIGTGNDVTADSMRRWLWEDPASQVPGTSVPDDNAGLSEQPPTEPPAEGARSPGSPPAALRRSEMIQVRIPEQEANRLITSAPQVQQALEQNNLHSLQVRFAPGRIIATARRPMWFGLDARVNATGTLRATEGGVEVDVTDVNVGNWPAPGGLQQELETQLQAAVDQLNARLGDQVRVEQIRITDQALIASVQPQ